MMISAPLSFDPATPLGGTGVATDSGSVLYVGDVATTATLTAPVSGKGGSIPVIMTAAASTPSSTSPVTATAPVAGPTIADIVAAEIAAAKAKEIKLPSDAIAPTVPVSAKKSLPNWAWALIAIAAAAALYFGYTYIKATKK